MKRNSLLLFLMSSPLVVSTALAACESEIAAVKQGSFPADPANIQAALQCVLDNSSGSSSTSNAFPTEAELDAACSSTTSGCLLDTDNSALETLETKTSIAQLLGIDTSVTATSAVFMKKFNTTNVSPSSAVTGPSVTMSLATGITGVCSWFNAGVQPGSTIINRTATGFNVAQSSEGSVASTNGSLRAQPMIVQRPTDAGLPSTFAAWLICYSKTTTGGSLAAGVPQSFTTTPTATWT